MGVYKGLRVCIRGFQQSFMRHQTTLSDCRLTNIGALALIIHNYNHGLSVCRVYWFLFGWFPVLWEFQDCRVGDKGLGRGVWG